MRKKRLISLLLAVLIVLPLLAVGTLAVGGSVGVTERYVPRAIESAYFYEQLNARARAIYRKLLTEFSGSNRAAYFTGTAFIDLMGVEGVDAAAVEAYKLGNKDLFNDFCAAKDALDLDHSELWWIDSGYLSFRVTQDLRGYHVLIEPGRGETYLLGGQAIGNIEEKIAAVNARIDTIVSRAIADAAAADHEGVYSLADQKAALVRSVHNQIVESISYRYEIDCSTSENARYIRTLYAIATHEGVCEAYARMLQVCLTRLGIPCVLVHGLQTKGTPEDHMWNAVRIDDGGTQRWFAVDATWDDPASSTYTGELDKSGVNGKDGKENTNYLLVGQNVIGEHWIPSGFVSTGTFEFTYPDIEMSSYSGSTAFEDGNGLKIMYSAGSGSMEDDVPAGVFTASFLGKGQAEAARDGIYFLLKMYDVHDDGTIDAMSEWYYVSAALKLLESNKYFYDAADGVHIYTGTCEYVEVAVTTRKPATYDQWAGATNFAPYINDAFFTGTDDEIIAQSGLLYNTNSKYEAPPYVYRQTPIPNAQATAGYDYRFEVLYDDALIHPVSAAAQSGIAKADLFVDNTETAAGQRVRVKYVTLQEDLRTGGTVAVQIAGKLPFDKNSDGYVDMPGDILPSGEAVESALVWHYVYGDDMSKCPNAVHGTRHVCDVNAGCPIDGVSFNFRASDLWQDDITEYVFQIEGVVGSRSGKFPNTFGVTCAVPGLCPACYRSQGIDWNLWGKPTLLDAPENLDLHEMAVAGGTDPATLAKLDEQINKNGLNGRLMLVVEDKSRGVGNRAEYEAIDGYLKDHVNVGEVLGSSVFEINFNRICPAVKLKPGESLRVQVGYPAGITYEMLTGGTSDIELKAYHFTRCDAAHKCANYFDTGHKDGEHIVGVEEITMIPTPYGLVIMCDAFSPFEIVAVRKTRTAYAKSTNTVVVVSDSNGVVKYVNERGRTVTAVGDDGNLVFPSGRTVEFTVEPKAGYVVDSVSLGGRRIAVVNGKFTLAAGVNVTGSDVLSVTFVPAQVQIREAEAGQTAVTAAVCTHTVTRKVVEVGRIEKAPTCTEAGYAFAVVCAHCGQVISQAHEIPATGHKLTTLAGSQEPTCTEPGYRGILKCTVCGFIASDGAQIPALGHHFSTYTVVEGTATCKGATATSVCDRCGQATDTRVDPALAVEHQYSAYTLTANATCSKNAVETAKCIWCGVEASRQVEGSALGHRWGFDGFCTVCGKYRCFEEGHKLEDFGAAAVSCTQLGFEAGKKCAVCGEIVVIPKPIPAQGHRYGQDGRCSVCGRLRVHGENDHTQAVLEGRRASCADYGLNAGIYCSVCGDIITPQTLIAPADHTGNAAVAEWHWSTEDGVSAVVVMRCTVDGQVRTFKAAMNFTPAEDRAPTCTEEGFGSFTATATVGSRTVSAVRDNMVIPATGHTVDKYTYNNDSTCTKHGTETGVCSVCGLEITRTTDTLAPHTYTYTTVEPTCTEAGYTTGVCRVCHHTETTGTLPALGHSFVNGVCTRCGLLATGAAANPKQHPVIREFVAFKDVPQGAWYEADLRYSYVRGLISGTGLDTFSPSEYITKVQMIALLARFDYAAGSQGADWDTASIAWAISKGIFDGIDPAADITREELVAMLWRYYGRPDTGPGLTAFKDAGKVSGWAKDAFEWAVGVGIINGVTDTELAPQGKATRAEAAVIFARFARLLEG